MMLNSISIAPSHSSQVGAISNESRFKVVLSVRSKLRNEDSPNVVISFESAGGGERINETMERISRNSEKYEPSLKTEKTSETCLPGGIHQGLGEKRGKKQRL